MKKQQLILGISIGLVATACTGIGVQTGPTLTSQIAEEQGLGTLWVEAQDAGPNGAVELRYADDVELADLWMEPNEPGPLGDNDQETPRATALLDRLTLTESVFGSYSNTSEVLPK